MERRPTQPQDEAGLDICDECQQPIPKGDEYFWGRYGGSWHPVCMARLEARGCAVIGMWYNRGLGGGSPDDYTAERQRLRDATYARPADYRAD